MRSLEHAIELNKLGIFTYHYSCVLCRWVSWSAGREGAARTSLAAHYRAKHGTIGKMLTAQAKKIPERNHALGNPKTP